MRLRVFSFLLAPMIAAASAVHATPYVIDAAPAWKLEPAVAPSPSPVLSAEPVSATVAISPTPSPKRRKGGLTDTPSATATGTPTPTLTPIRVTGLYLAPFQDKRRIPEIWSGRSIYEKVVMEPAGATLLAKAWRHRPFSDMSYFWHRQFAYALGSSGYAVTASDTPFEDQAAALVAAKLTGAKILVTGQITRLSMAKKGADSIFGTAFSGINYYLNLELNLKAVDVASGNVLVDKTIEQQRLFYDPTRMGGEDRDTFPRFFATGLPELALRVAGDDRLLNAAGMPTFTHTSTPTPTPEAIAPKKGDAPTPLPSATPDTGPYWVNPKTGKRVDPTWNFDPSDGTPRDKFVLRQPDPQKPSRPTEAK